MQWVYPSCAICNTIQTKAKNKHLAKQYADEASGSTISASLGLEAKSLMTGYPLSFLSKHPKNKIESIVNKRLHSY